MRQKKGQNVQEYTTEFQKQAVLLGLNLWYRSTLDKYKGGFYHYLCNELALFEVQSIDDACTKVMYVEKRERKLWHHQQNSQKEKGKSHEEQTAR